MRRFIITVAVFLVALTLTTSTSRAQWQYAGPYVGPYVGPYGMGVYGGFWPYGGFNPYGDYGFGPNASFGPWGGLGYAYGPYNYSQQLGMQQAYLTQQVYQQQQQAIVDQVRQAEGRLDKLDTSKQQLFQKYLEMSESEKVAVRSGLMSDYLRLDARGRDGWRRDSVVQAILGKDLPRLEGLAEFGELNDSDQLEFRRALLQKYRRLSAADQRAWQSDPVVAAVMGRDWWLK